MGGMGGGGAGASFDDSDGSGDDDFVVDVPTTNDAYTPVTTFFASRNARTTDVLRSGGGGGGGGGRHSRELAFVERFRQEHESFLVDFAQLQIGAFLSSGATSAVHLGLYRSAVVAIKLFRPDRIDEHTIAFFHRENALSAAFQDPNIVRYYGLCVMPPHIALVFEYCKYGSLYQLIDKIIYARREYMERYGPEALDAYGCLGEVAPEYAAACAAAGVPLPRPPPGLSWRRRLRMARDGAAALAFMHSLTPPYVHRDVKSQNFLVGEGYSLKMADFGETRAVSRSHPMTVDIGTVNWMAPEMIAGATYDESIDIYSYGVVLWELLTHDHPFSWWAPARIKYEVGRGATLPIPADCPRSYADLMAACWNRNPRARPPAATVLRKVEKLLAREERRRNLLRAAAAAAGAPPASSPGAAAAAAAAGAVPGSLTNVPM